MNSAHNLTPAPTGMAGFDGTAVCRPGRALADILRDAANYLETHGWFQGDYYNNGHLKFPACCALGAVAMAVYGQVVDCPSDCGDPDGERLFTTTRAVLRDWLVDELLIDPSALDEPEDIDDSSTVVGAWNDHPNQTAFAVKAQLRAAAHWWDSKHGAAK